MIFNGLYIHVPYCRNKCIYCDFYSAGLRIADWDIYIKAILEELRIRNNELSNPPDTFYIGGGTPSLIPAEPFMKLSKEIMKITRQHSPIEFTLEANPEDINEEIIQVWKDYGVNRISLGVQSLQGAELKNIGRKHTKDTVLNALSLLKKIFNNISVDVMFGLPGQTIDSYKYNLKEILKFQPDHISSYSLMLEEGTALTHLVKNGRLILPSENEWIDMFNLTTEFLIDNGFNRYEISNYAKPGFESLHNSDYWLGFPYLGIGPGAHSYDGKNIRKSNPNDLKGYINFFNECSINELKNFYKIEILNHKELEEEMIMTRLRTTKGLSITEFKNKFGTDITENLLHKVSTYKKNNLMKEINDYVSFTDKGFLVSDEILTDLI